MPEVKLNKAFIDFGKSGSTVITTLKGISAVLDKFTGPVTVATFAIDSLNAILELSATRAEQARRELQDYQVAFNQLSVNSMEREVDILNQRIQQLDKALQEARKKEEESSILRSRFAETSVSDKEDPRIGELLAQKKIAEEELQKAKDALGQRVQRENERLELQAELMKTDRTVQNETLREIKKLEIRRAFEKKWAEEDIVIKELVVSRHLAIDKKYEEERRRIELQAKSGLEAQEVTVTGTMPTPESIGTAPQSAIGGVDLGEPKLSKVPTNDPQTQLEEPKKQFQELSKESQAFISAFDSGMSRQKAAGFRKRRSTGFVEQGIHQCVGGAFRRTFGEANLVLGKFLKPFVDVDSLGSNHVGAC